MSYTLEIIGFNIESCITAQQAGAGRIELCDSPADGGTTPSQGFIKAARRILQIPLYVMIRPRGGDFLYTEEEFRIMLDDIAVCKQAGCDGVVIGMLDADGNIDVNRTTRLVEAAYPMGVTFHRAFDRVKDFRKSLKDVIATGCERILTSGLVPRCEEGLGTIKELVELAQGDIIIMPGSGVKSTNIQKIISETKVTEIHSSASVTVESEMSYLNKAMNEQLNHVAVNAEEVRKMSEIIRKM